MREPMIGDQVHDERTGSVGYALDVWRRHDGRLVVEALCPAMRGRFIMLDPIVVEYDIPRGRVADLHAAVTKRVEQLASDEALDDDCAAVVHLELSEVAEALRLLLEADDAE